MAVMDTFPPNNMPIQRPKMNKRKKYCPIQHQSVMNKNKQNTEKLLLYPILGPLFHIHKIKDIKFKFMQNKDLLQCSMSSAYFLGGKAYKNVDV